MWKKTKKGLEIQGEKLINEKIRLEKLINEKIQ